VTSGDEFEELARSFNGMATRIESQFRFLTAIHEIDRAVLSSLDRDIIVRTALTGGRQFLEADAIAVLLCSPDGPQNPGARVTVAVSDAQYRTQDVPLAPDDLALLGGHSGGLEFRNGDARPGYLEAAAVCPCRIWLVVPIVSRERVAGAVLAGWLQPTRALDEPRRHARQLADQMAVALSNARLLEQLESLRRGALTALARTIDAKSSWTAGHSERVTALALAIGRRHNLPPEQLDVIYRGGLLHDIGKIGVPAEVLDKEGKLTETEFAVMRSHVEIGVRILAPIEAHADILPIVYHHHERLDGSGYPHGLAGDAIPFEARLLAVADVFDAVSSPRPYRPPWDRAKAIGYIQDLSGVHFDPPIVKSFLEMANSGELPSAPETADTAYPVTLAAGAASAWSPR
jgi:putative nucleotidyltransferase with HDIG domain